MIRHDGFFPNGCTKEVEESRVFDFLQLMYHDGLLSPNEMGALQKICTELKERPVRVLRSLNIVSQPEIQGLLQEFYGVGICTQELIDNLTVDHGDIVPVDLAVSCSCVGISQEKDLITVLLEDPSDTAQLTKLEFFLEKRVAFVVATANQLMQAIEKVYGVKSEDQKLTTVLEASRGVVGGKAYDPSQLTQYARHDDLLVDQTDKIETLRSLLMGGLAEKLARANAAIDQVGGAATGIGPESAQGFLVDSDEDEEVDEGWAVQTSQALAHKIMTEARQLEESQQNLENETSVERSEPIRIHAPIRIEQQDEQEWTVSRSCLVAIPKLMFEMSKKQSHDELFSYINANSELTGFGFVMLGSDLIELTELESGLVVLLARNQDLPVGLSPLRALFKILWKALLRPQNLPLAG
jgi:Type II secretion system (T2SS), protein E, N-terminal domain